MIFCDVAPPDVLQIDVAVLAAAAAYPLEAYIGSEPVQTEQHQAEAQRVFIERIAGTDGTKRISEMNAQLRIFEDVEQVGLVIDLNKLPQIYVIST